MPRFLRVRGHTILASALGPSPCVVDLGANRGLFSQELRALAGGSYLLVEANPGLAAALVSRDAWRVVPCAVAAKDAEIDFHIARNDEASSLLELPASSEYHSEEVARTRVPVRRLESLLVEFGITRVDLLKMDVEGSEVEVLLAVAENVLAEIRQLSVEFHCHPSFGLDLRDGTLRAIARLQDLGFLCVDFSHGKLMDVLFLNLKALNLTRLRQRLLLGQAAIRIFFWRLRGRLFGRSTAR